jgi:Ser/Thr protein kinase RdoA (MazF antagonist)
MTQATEASTAPPLPADTVRDRVLPHYRLSPPLRCRFLARGLHDTYLVESGTERHVVRLYRSRWRTRADILFELELLRHLQQRSCPVAYPLSTAAGEPLVWLRDAGGERAAALFVYAPGSAPGAAITPRQGEALGQVVAGMHRAADTFTTAHTRQVLDLDYLLDASVDAVLPYLTRPQRQTLQALQRRIRAAMPALPRQAPGFGPCSGDVNPRNFHVDEHGRITLFDFDQCGLGWRAFEIGKFFASLPHDAQRAPLAAAFLRGYEAVRALQPDERRALPLFVPVSAIWVMALYVYNADLVGDLLRDPGFWARKMAALERLAGC